MLDQLMGMLTGQGGMYDPALGSLLATQPEAIIPHLVEQGVPPPQMAFASGGLPGMVQQGTRGIFDWLGGGSGATPPAEAPATLRPPYLNPPRGRVQPTVDAPPAPEPPAASSVRTGASPDFPPAPAETPAQQPAQQQGMMNALAGLRPPPAPAVQSIRSPSAPRPLAIQSNPLMSQLLLAASGGTSQVNPLALRSALLGGR